MSVSYLVYNCLGQGVRPPTFGFKDDCKLKVIKYKTTLFVLLFITVNNTVQSLIELTEPESKAASISPAASSKCNKPEKKYKNKSVNPGVSYLTLKVSQHF